MSFGSLSLRELELTNIYTHRQQLPGSPREMVHHAIVQHYTTEISRDKESLPFIYVHFKFSVPFCRFCFCIVRKPAYQRLELTEVCMVVHTAS